MFAGYFLMEAPGEEAFWDLADQVLAPTPCCRHRDRHRGAKGTGPRAELWRHPVPSATQPNWTQRRACCPACGRLMQFLCSGSITIFITGKEHLWPGRLPLIHSNAISGPTFQSIGTKCVMFTIQSKGNWRSIFEIWFENTITNKGWTRLTRAETSEKRSLVPSVLWKSHTFNYFHHYRGNCCPSHLAQVTWMNLILLIGITSLLRSFLARRATWGHHLRKYRVGANERCLTHRGSKNKTNWGSGTNQLDSPSIGVIFRELNILKAR